MLIDDREGSKDLIRSPALRDVATLARLDSGDVAILGNGPDGPGTLNVGIEYKSVHDFLSSMATGRLTGTDGQLDRMLREYDVVWLLIRGTYRAGPGNRLEVLRGGRFRTHRIGGRDVPYGYVESALTAMALEAGVFTKQVTDEAQAAAWLACLGRSLAKPWDKRRLFRKFNRAGEQALPGVDADTLVRMNVARAVAPGVGWEKALHAAHHFESPAAIVNASVEEWMKVPGVGKVIARSAVSTARRRTNHG